MATQQSWQARAEELHDAGGIPQRCAEVVALREQGMTYQQIADELGMGGKGRAHSHRSAYDRHLEQARWLLEHGPADGALEAGD